MGVPGINGFPAEFLLIPSALDTHTGAGLAGGFYPDSVLELTRTASEDWVRTLTAR